MAAFLRRAIAMSLADRVSAAALTGWVFFDRGLVDAAAGLEHLTGEAVVESLGRTHRFYRRVFLAPPWPELYVTDLERRHGFDFGVAEYSRLFKIYPALGYELILLPKLDVGKRADFVLMSLAE